MLRPPFKVSGGRRCLEVPSVLLHQVVAKDVADVSPSRHLSAVASSLLCLSSNRNKEDAKSNVMEHRKKGRDIIYLVSVWLSVTGPSLALMHRLGKQRGFRLFPAAAQ